LINEAIRLLRVYNDIKQKDLAEKLNVSTTFLCEIEKGKRPVSPETVKKYSVIFNLNTDCILQFAVVLKKNKNIKKDIFKNIIKTILEDD
jgi:transcriptional regulator with XRE-family HTH domain